MHCICTLTRSAATAAQLSVMLSVLNLVYKVIVVYSAINLQMSFTKREELIKQMELEAGLGGAPSSAPATATTSSGEPLDSRSLAAQAGK